jgi:hypothetical protein
MELANQSSRYNALGRLFYVLERRYGHLSGATVARLSHLTLEELDAVRARARDCRTLEEALGPG